MYINLSGKDFNNHAAVFLDRDGVLNRSEKPDGSYLPVNTPDDLFIYDQAKEGLAELTKKTDLLKIVVTNQGGIGAGYMTTEELDSIHGKLISEVRDAGGNIDAIYYATSNDEKDPLRKPNPGLLLKAAEELNIDLSRSYMVGDMTTDIAAGENADGRLTSILVKTGKGGKDHKVEIQPDLVMDDFKHAAEFIIADYNKKLEKT